jgi:hypothetical protein
MFDYEIDFALECVPAADRTRLTRILSSLSIEDIERVNEHVRHEVSRFNQYRRDTPGSAGRAAHDALVCAIKAVRIDC